MIHIRTMSEADLPLGMRLKTQAGWNQTVADWQRVFELEPDGCFAAQFDGASVGTTVAVRFGNVAWIMMVLVDEALRGRGIGTRLMQHALDYLDGHAVPTVRLDATPLGRPVYEKLGFQVEYELARFQHTGVVRKTGKDAQSLSQNRRGLAHLAESSEQRVPVPFSADGSEINSQPLAAQQLDAICALDRQATGSDRSRLVRRLYAEQPSSFQIICDGAEIVGYATFRIGSRAIQLGPVVTASPSVGPALLDHVIAHCGPTALFIDIPLENLPAVQWAQANGFTVQRYLTRMFKGDRIQDRPAELWASFGPEKG